MPIQSKGAKGIKGQVAVNEDLAAGLSNLDGFSHIFLIYHFHKSTGFNLLVTPFLDKTQTRSFCNKSTAKAKCNRHFGGKIFEYRKKYPDH